mmetsp:Transcript_8216/g.10740  ORF Transcript_8216/g.10740 Transcript_8216/m.10740 type:complete len:405 (-) Transcript_8216:11-1225(-)
MKAMEFTSPEKRAPPTDQQQQQQYSGVGDEEADDIITTMGSHHDEDEHGVVVLLTTRNNMNYSYLKSFDCKELACCLVFYVMTLAVHSTASGILKPPHQRPIPFQYLENADAYVRNLTNNETLNDRGETIPDYLLVILAFLLPLAIQETLCFLQGRRRRQQHNQQQEVQLVSAKSFYFYDMHATICVYLVASAINLIATEFIKLYVGYLRPIFYEECQPNENFEFCTNEEKEDDVRKSFVSGHASMSFCGLSLLTMYIHCRFGGGYAAKQQQKQQEQANDAAADDERRRLLVAALVQAIEENGTTSTTSMQSLSERILLAEEQQHASALSSLLSSPSPDSKDGRATTVANGKARLISILALLPMALALFIAASRVHDNKHFPADVVGGAVLGAAISHFVNGLWF